MFGLNREVSQTKEKWTNSCDYFSGLGFLLVQVWLVFIKLMKEPKLSTLTSKSTNQTREMLGLVFLHNSGSQQDDHPQRSRKKTELSASLMFVKLSFPVRLCLNRHSGKKGEKCNQLAE